jgi:hypothetical protein
MIFLALACGGGGGGGTSFVTTSADPVTISGTVDDDTGLSKPGRGKITTSGLSIEATNLNTNVAIPSANLSFNTLTGAYTVSVPQGTPFSVEFVQNSISVLSRVISSSDTQSSGSKDVSLVTHLQAKRVLKEAETTSLDAAFSKVNIEIFGSSAPTESDMLISRLPQSMQVALMTYREAASNVATDSTSVSTLITVFESTTTSFNQAYRDVLTGTLQTLHSTASTSNPEFLTPSIFNAVEEGAADETAGEDPTVILPTPNGVLRGIGSTSFPVDSNNRLQGGGIYILEATSGTPVKSMAKGSISLYDNQRLVGRDDYSISSDTSSGIVILVDNTYSIEESGVTDEIILAINSGFYETALSRQTDLYTFNSIINYHNVNLVDETVILPQPSSLTTALYDSAYSALATSVGYENPFVLIVNDGEDNSSSRSLQDVIDLRDQYGISVFCVGYGNANQEELSQIASANQMIYASTPSGLSTAIANAAAVRASYFQLIYSARAISGTHSFDIVASQSGITGVKADTYRINLYTPSITSTSVLSFLVGGSSQLQLTGTDLDGDNTSFTLSNNPNWVILNSSDQLVASSDTVQSTSVTVQLSDGEKNGSRNVTVSAYNNLPVFASVASQRTLIDTLVSLNVDATDEDGHSITYSLSGAPSFLAINGLTGEVSGNATIQGSYNYSILASDGYQNGAVSVAHEVYNTLPTTDSRSDQDVLVDTIYSDQLIATDADGHALTFALENSPSWLSIDSVEGSLVGNAIVRGVQSVTVNVNDGYDTAQFTWGLNVYNTSPLISSNNIINSGLNLTYQIDASDGDNHSLSYSLHDAPDWLSISSSGLITGTSSSDNQITFSVNVTDGYDITTTTIAANIYRFLPNSQINFENDPSLDSSLVTLRSRVYLQQYFSMPGGVEARLRGNSALYDLTNASGSDMIPLVTSVHNIRETRIGDVNNDGVNDAVSVLQTYGIWWHDSNATYYSNWFEVENKVTSDSFIPVSIDVADFHNDNKNDILIATDTAIVLYQNNDNATSFTRYDLNETLAEVEGAMGIDIDNDGDTDLAYKASGNYFWIENTTLD